MSNQDKECCPQFDSLLWDGRTFEWSDKKFIKDSSFTLFYMPINFGLAMKRMNEKLIKSGASVLEGMWLSDHTSKWNMDLYLAVDQEVADAENVTISGKFLSKVYEGDFKDTGKWSEDFKKYVTDKGVSIKKMYMWYTTCPKCAKKYGKNYVAIFAQIE